MADTLRIVLGSVAEGFSTTSSVSHLARQWQAEREQKRRRTITEPIVYVWADRLYCGLRAEDAKLCALVFISVDGRGNKRLLAIEHGMCESNESPYNSQ